jgi:hypothetical protein
VVARLRAHGTHQREVMGMPPTGKQVAWAEIHIFRRHLHGNARWRCAPGFCLPRRVECRRVPFNQGLWFEVESVSL